MPLSSNFACENSIFEMTAQMVTIIYVSWSICKWLQCYDHDIIKMSLFRHDPKYELHDLHITFWKPLIMVKTWTVNYMNGIKLVNRTTVWTTVFSNVEIQRRTNQEHILGEVESLLQEYMVWLYCKIFADFKKIAEVRKGWSNNVQETIMQSSSSGVSMERLI